MYIFDILFHYLNFMDEYNIYYHNFMFIEIRITQFSDLIKFYLKIFNINKVDKSVYNFFLKDV